jgi:hypothetical protein
MGKSAETTDETGAETEPGAGRTGRPSSRRRFRVALIVLFCVVIALPVAVAGGVWLRLGAGPLTLPPSLSGRIEARLDAAMSANRVTLDRIEVHRSDGAEAFTLRLVDVRLADADGTLRAAFPSLTVAVSPL